MLTNLLQMCWKSPNLWLLVSMPVPMTRPPIVRSSSSGTIGMVQPRWSSVAVSWPMVTKGSHLTVRFSVLISKTSTRLTCRRKFKIQCFTNLSTYINRIHLSLVLHVLRWDCLPAWPGGAHTLSLPIHLVITDLRVAQVRTRQQQLRCLACFWISATFSLCLVGALLIANTILLLQYAIDNMSNKISKLRWILKTGV